MSGKCLGVSGGVSKKLFLRAELVFVFCMCICILYLYFVFLTKPGCRRFVVPAQTSKNVAPEGKIGICIFYLHVYLYFVFVFCIFIKNSSAGAVWCRQVRMLLLRAKQEKPIGLCSQKQNTSVKFLYRIQVLSKFLCGIQAFSKFSTE